MICGDVLTAQRPGHNIAFWELTSMPQAADQDAVGQQETVDAAVEMRRIRNQIRQRRAHASLSGRSESISPGDRARLRHYLHLARQYRQVKELPFESPTPIIGPFVARFRALWNSIACKWHVRRILAQQNAYNRAVFDLLASLLAEIDGLDVMIDEQAQLLQEHEIWRQDMEYWRTSVDSRPRAVGTTESARAPKQNAARQDDGGAGASPTT